MSPMHGGYLQGRRMRVRGKGNEWYVLCVNMAVIRDGSAALCIQRTCLEGGLIEMWGLQHGATFTSSPRNEKKGLMGKRDSTEFS